MPTYDYACANCGNRFEVRQSINADPLTDCPQCHGMIKRVIHASGIVFKGSGFYKTDSRTSTKESAASTTPAAGDKDTAPADGAKPSTETKPAEATTAVTNTAETKPAKPATQGTPSSTTTS